VIVKDESPLTILLDDAVQNLDEMTVVGYASNGVGAPSSDSDKKVVAVVDIPKVKETPQEKVIFQVVEEMPEFPGGMAECMKWLGKNIKYPTISQENGVQGRVIIQFVVNRDGSIVDAQVARGVDPYLDKEALRVVGLMPKWKPGKQRGKEVRVKYTLPVMFRLQ
jgi:protein TonB